MTTFANKVTVIRSASYKLRVVAVLLINCIALLNCFYILGQTPDGSSAIDSKSYSVTTLRTSTRLVQVDIVATDTRGHPVTGFTQEDFSVAEDNVSQMARNFETHVAEIESANTAPKIPQLPPNTYLNIVKAPEYGRPTVILYDLLNTSLTDRDDGRRELLAFIKQRRPGSQMAIFVLSDKLHLVQGFTDDLGATPELKQAIQHFSDIDLLNRGAGGLNSRRTITLGALSTVGRFLSTMPGRKNLIWYSSGFPENIFSNSTMMSAPIFPGQTPSMTKMSGFMYNFSEQIKQATDLLNLAHVAVYPVDVRGIIVGPVFSSARNAQFGPNTSGWLASRQAFINMDTAVRATMDSVADDTGGHASYGTNDLQGALDRATLDGSTYYSLSYSPTNPKYDGSLRHIKITLKKSGYTLAYRKTYYADDLEAAARAAADAPVSPLSPSLERGTPLAHDLLIEAHLDAAGPPVPATPAQMQVLSQYEAMRTKNKNTKPAPVMMQQYFISYGLIARQLDMPEDDKGAHQASIEFGMIAYDDDGRKLNGLDSRIDDAIPAPRYAKVTADGYHAVQSIAVPVTATSLRLAVRDIHSNRTGSLEVKLPLAKTVEANAQASQQLQK